MKGVFELKRVLPQYSHTWDVDTVLNLLECYAPNDKLTGVLRSYWQTNTEGILSQAGDAVGLINRPAMSNNS